MGDSFTDNTIPTLSPVYYPETPIKTAGLEGFSSQLGLPLGWVTSDLGVFLEGGLTCGTLTAQEFCADDETVDQHREPGVTSKDVATDFCTSEACSWKQLRQADVESGLRMA